MNILRTAKQCCLLDTKGQVSDIYESFAEAGRCHGLDSSAIKQVCDGVVKSVKGKVFRYYDEGVIEMAFAKGAHLQVCGISVYDRDDILIFKNVSQAAIQTGGNRGSISKCIHGSSKYSITQNRIWRKIDLFGNVIDNERPIENLIKTRKGGDGNE